MNGEWKSTCVLAYSRFQTVLQRWEREVVEYREYNGNPTPRRCVRTEYEWRELPGIDSFDTSQDGCREKP